MTRPFRLFLETEVSTDCDACGGRVDLVKGGACEQCRRVLCATHLHGSFARRILVDLGARTLCVDCRAGRPIAPRRHADARQ
ncbi:MAG TPA: hypothetical protein VFZ21_23265 [Gemmatimonadaceae bacterium]|nr:hypothetical protein [Gemmatimonadaceae bacterium]